MESEEYGLVIGFPSEMLIALLAIALVFRWLHKGYSDKLFLKHPITRVLCLYLLLTFLSSAFSSMPLISIKASIVRTSYILVFYFGLNDVFKEKLSSIKILFLRYGFSLFAVGLYFLYFQSLYNWNKETAGISVNPFYADHTIFSACLVYLIPIFIAQVSLKGHSDLNRYCRLLYFLLLSFMLLTIFCTYCRAAWISMIAGLIFLFFSWMKLKPKFYFSLFLSCVLVFFLYRNEIWIAIQENNSISTSPTTNVIEQTQSITNVSTDVSNAERLNRWSCALRMFLDEPFLGFGPGTFQFQYLSYQLPDETTYISVYSPYNIPKGRGGSAHSEYLLVLAESGLFSFLLFLILLGTGIYTAIQVLRYEEQKNVPLLLPLLLGFFMYCIHGFFNNYLDTDKAAFLFYASLSYFAGASCVLTDAQKKTPESIANRRFLSV
ncbi:MAG: O-antigen ligase family protein [Bacteroidetes bacterium]|nr:O-antigen ligase family protein [Bacteroidota bacterium]